MDIRGLSDNGLKMLHEALRDAFEEDEALPAHAKKYGVRQFGDWKTWSDTLEAELTRRELQFSPVQWTTPALPKAPVRVFYYGKHGPYGAFPTPGEIYIIQHYRSGPFFVEQIPTTGGPAQQLSGPHRDVAAAQSDAARY